VVSQFLMATPMIILYNISILFAWRVTVKRERAEAAQRAREDAPS
jgi:Sec-independent protein secretion pathway component TatC